MSNTCGNPLHEGANRTTRLGQYINKTFHQRYNQSQS